MHHAKAFCSRRCWQVASVASRSARSLSLPGNRQVVILYSAGSGGLACLPSPGALIQCHAETGAGPQVRPLCLDAVGLAPKVGLHSLWVMGKSGEQKYLPCSK